MSERYGVYELKPVEAELLGGISEVTTIIDEYGNGAVINKPENGIAAGDRIRTIYNFRFDEEKPAGPDNPRYIHWLTDDYNAAQSVRIAEAKRQDEAGRMQAASGVTTIVTSYLPRFAEMSATHKQHYIEALERLASDDERAINPHKRRAVDQAEGSSRLLTSTGSNVPTIVDRKLTNALDEFDERARELDQQAANNRERSDRLQQETRLDLDARLRLKLYGEMTLSVAEHPEDFLYVASRRRTKPGVLTVNNAWYHREDEDSWQRMIVAQEGFEEIYGLLMKPMSQLAAARQRDMRQDPDKFVGLYGDRLAALMSVIDLANIGGDYTTLSERLQELVFDTDELLFSENFGQTLKTARLYRFLLRYRILPGEEVPVQWYGGLPGIRSGRDPVRFSAEVEDDTYYGLPQ